MTWWVVSTAPAQERRAVAGLSEAGFDTWCPMRTVFFKCRYMKVRSEREYPVFPSYAFVDPGPVVWHDAWHRMRAIEDVKAILTNDSYPLGLCDLEMARVRAHLECLAHKPVDMDTWREDDRARITEGPFEGQEGVVSRGARRGSVELLLSLFGRQTATEVAVEMLEKAG